MPTLISVAAASGKGYGLLGTTRPLTTVNFTSNGTWVAPAGVTLVALLTGIGQDGSTQYGGLSTQYWTFNSFGGLANPPYAQWADLYNAGLSARNSLASAIGGYGPSSVLTSLRYYIGDDNTWVEADVGYTDLSPYIIDSVTPLYVSNGSPQTSGNITYPAGYNSWSFDATFNLPAFIGASSSGIGYTFPGGSYGPAAPASYSNVPVTPGTSYPITVAPGGYVIIQYYT